MHMHVDVAGNYGFAIQIIDFHIRKILVAIDVIRDPQDLFSLDQNILFSDWGWGVNVGVF